MNEGRIMWIELKDRVLSEKQTKDELYDSVPFTWIKST